MVQDPIYVLIDSLKKDLKKALILKKKKLFEKNTTKIEIQVNYRVYAGKSWSAAITWSKRNNSSQINVRIQWIRLI